MPTSVFLSCVTTGLGSYRRLLLQQLQAIKATVRAQELLQNRGGRLFALLEEDI